MGVNKDLQKERNTASFNSDDMTNLLDGGTDQTGLRREVFSTLFSDPVFSTKEKHSHDMRQRYERALGKMMNTMYHGIKNGWAQDHFMHAFTAARYDLAISVHPVMFLPTIERLGTEEQVEKWLADAMTMKMIGTYAQTELGHGTNVRNLETTATYDPQTQEFILSTPTLSSMKWWPGGLAKSTNHVILLAQLVVGGKNCGIQAFMLQIRDMDTHMPLSGIEVGDIGPRMGLVTADNGFLRLDNVRIPRENMLMKYAQVTPDGRFIQSGSDKANYGTMMLVRANIVSAGYFYMSQAATIATRYSAVRHQSELTPGEPEPQILDYQTQQYKLFPNIALAYAVNFARRYMLDYYHDVYNNEISKGVFDSVPELHSQSSGLKALVSDLITEGIEICRRSCGGHGYMMSSGIADLYLDSLGSVTYEGENTVMYLQTARYLMKSFTTAMQGGNLNKSSSYLASLPHVPSINNVSDLQNFGALKQVFLRRSFHKIRTVGEKLDIDRENGVPQHLSWNKHSVELVNAAKAHIDGFLTINFLERVTSLEAKPEIKRVLTILAQLYAYHRISLCAGDYIESGALNAKQVEMIREEEMSLLPVIRPNAVALVDSFDWHDEILGRTLGRYDGNVYEALYEAAKLSPMNTKQVHEGALNHVKEFHKKLSKL